MLIVICFVMIHKLIGTSSVSVQQFEQQLWLACLINVSQVYVIHQFSVVLNWTYY